jgi:hypothetical protein
MLQEKYASPSLVRGREWDNAVGITYSEDETFEIHRIEIFALVDSQKFECGNVPYDQNMDTF